MAIPLGQWIVIWIVAMALAGTLFVIPTTGEVLIVQAMLALGMGAGALQSGLS